jgi:hypothetical protein
MKKLFVLSIIVFICLNLFAQNKRNEQNEKEIDYKVIKMPKYSIADFPKKSTTVSNIEIIQKVSDSVCLGFVFKGLGNQAAEIITKKNLTSFLQDHIFKMYADDFRNGGIKILWVLKKLRISEKTSMFSEYSYLKFNADSYISTDNESYKLVTTIDTVFVSSSGMDVTAWHGTEIEDAFKLLLKRTLKNESDGAFASNKILSITQIKDSFSSILYPILKTLKYQEGGYANFNEFLENKPSVQNFLLQVRSENRIICFAPNKIDTIKLWGLCRQGEIYKYAHETLIPIEKFRNGFMISDYIKNVNRRNNRDFIIGFAGGLVGVAIMNSQKESNQYLVTSIPYIKKNHKRPEASCINMETGELSF